MSLYAAYGSNLDPAQMRQRCPHSPVRGTGWLPGWRLTFGGEDLGWDGALATIVPDHASRVFVLVYDLDRFDEANLDMWEGADSRLYAKLHLRVVTLDGDLLAWAYVLDGYEGGLPSERHLNLIIEGAERAGAPDDYVVELRKMSTRGE